ncbi:calcium/sodium antiporter [Athalassotoga saccharophila]|uniref:calcium/sodium antiporter n=1 Tax=Athalassotoga saccharophila TaxID=1441386 RepID=UPI00137A7E78|nr:calcium/sodium antiporter [Athalassotoga saccharophila]BBJ27483.1 inner membrane protein YrbG [Athalassotoga saccharophila]
MYILLQIIFLAIALLLLERGSDWLVGGASDLARHFKVSELFIGLTIVAFGTSAPELAVSLAGAFNNSGSVAIGNVVGSNIVNASFILGISIFLGSISIKVQTLKYEIPLVIVAQFIATMLFLKNDSLNFYDGMVLLAVFGIFMSYVLSTSKQDVKTSTQAFHKLSIAIILTIIGLVGVVAGGEIGVYAAVNLARSLKVSETLIAVTIVAFGTSVPELVTSVRAALKSKNEIAVGNIMGSNIFNILAILGLSALPGTIKTDKPITVDLIFMNVIGIIAFFIFFNSKRSAKKWEGLLLMAIYIVYILYSVKIQP